MCKTCCLAIVVTFACSTPAAEPDTSDREALPVSPDARGALGSAADAGKDPVGEPVSEPDAGKESASTPAVDDSPKNLRVLPKNWSLARVERYMKEKVVKGVGGKCVHCHKKNDFAADTKHKEEARDMMRLTRDLNNTYFEKKPRISCFTCHKGKHEPVQAR